jgi:hypothetical protein
LEPTDRKKVALMHIRRDTSPTGTVVKPIDARPRGFSAPPSTASTDKVRLCSLAPVFVAERPLSKAYIDEAMQAVKGLSGTVIGEAAEVVAAGLIAELQASGQFVLAGVGTFSLGEAKAVPTTHAGASAQKTVQFEACSSVLRQV